MLALPILIFKIKWRSLMKKLLVISLSFFVAFSVISCSSAKIDKSSATSIAADTAAKEATAKAEKEKAKAACKADCDKANDDCVKKAGKTKAKLDACAKAKTKCYADCDSK